jgi:hypothetical protein
MYYLHTKIQNIGHHFSIIEVTLESFLINVLASNPHPRSANWANISAAQFSLLRQAVSCPRPSNRMALDVTYLLFGMAPGRESPVPGSPILSLPLNGDGRALAASTEENEVCQTVAALKDQCALTEILPHEFAGADRDSLSSGIWLLKCQNMS